jgi:N-acetylglucosamine-6-sulfatase
MMRGPGIHPGSVRDIIGTHVDIMPTLLGLADGGLSPVPSTMDGENLAGELLLRGNDLVSHNKYRRTAVLIEYIGLGDVVRYGHLEDSYNNTFRALRVMDDTQPSGRRNLKYVEFTDCQKDWNFTMEPAEFELFDLDSDPFEMNNIISQVPYDLIRRLRHTTRRLFKCAGHICRYRSESSDSVS